MDRFASWYDKDREAVDQAQFAVLVGAFVRSHALSRPLRSALEWLRIAPPPGFEPGTLGLEVAHLQGFLA
jgi:hypothetical protein